ncbi:hypothetical protein JW758_00115 [Candidatus Peregrinibacteria bacterium]|nr:hypothetical protein [Candidatus Peregrinibacteria bacterium]
MKTKLIITLFAMFILTACNVVTTEGTLEENMEKSMDEPATMPSDESPWEEADLIIEDSELPANDNVKQYTLEEVALHTTEDDCWTIINSKVYDVTEAVLTHNPSILMGCGIDGTELFQNRPSTGTPHPEKAMENLNNYLIGELE